MMYILSNFANKKVGIRIAAKIIRPPIVGVPFLFSSPVNPRALTCSPICYFLISFIIDPPKTKETSNEVIIAMAARKEIYSNNPAPGKLYVLCKYSNK